MPSPANLKVTVAIPTYNRADFLRQTLAGIAEQQFPRDHFEVLIIDNNSRDHTSAVVAEFATARPAPRYILESQQGLDRARNRALREARGEIIVFGDDDILVQPDWLAQIAVPLLADGVAHRIGAVGGEVIPVFPAGLGPRMARAARVSARCRSARAAPVADGREPRVPPLDLRGTRPVPHRARSGGRQLLLGWRQRDDPPCPRRRLRGVVRPRRRREAPNAGESHHVSVRGAACLRLRAVAGDRSRRDILPAGSSRIWARRSGSRFSPC
jgi:glycosyltransferase involved in cell wall biosynthesis